MFRCHSELFRKELNMVGEVIRRTILGNILYMFFVVTFCACQLFCFLGLNVTFTSILSFFCIRVSKLSKRPSWRRVHLWCSLYQSLTIWCKFCQTISNSLLPLLGMSVTWFQKLCWDQYRCYSLGFTYGPTFR